MGGDATFAGTTYQARVISFVYVHILAQMRLGWLSPSDDTPTAVSGETEGPGDDAHVEFGARRPGIEIQAKHGLTGGAELSKVIDRIRTKSPAGTPAEVVLVVDRARSTRWIYTDLVTDIARLRSGRKTEIKAETARLLKELASSGASEDLLQALSVVPVDIDRPHDPEAKMALQLLETVVLSDPTQTAAAWAILVTDAADVCARKERRTRKDLADLLNGAGIRVRPPSRDDVWHRQLDFTKRLLQKRHADAALGLLADIEKGLSTLRADDVEPFVRYRVFQQRAAALLRLDRAKEALNAVRIALDIDPTGIHALTTASYSAVLAGELDLARTYAKKAVTSHPDDPAAWGALAQAAAATGDPLPTPKAAVAESSHYRTVLTEIAVERGDREAVLELTSQLLATGERSPLILFHRANTLIDASGRVTGLSDDQRYAEVERLASELLDTVAGEANSLAVKALVLRASARRLLNRIADADADLRAAREVQADDVDALSQEARVRADSGDLRGALELLRYPAVSEVPELLVLRARLAAQDHDDGAAFRDLHEALNKIKESDDPDRVRFAATDVALMLSDVALAERIFSGVSPERLGDVRSQALQARLAFAIGHIEDGTALYRAAIANHAEHRPMLIAELGSRLLLAGRHQDAATAYAEIDPGDLPDEAVRGYAVALFGSNDLVRLQELIDRLASKGPLPPWALGAATDIALRQEDTDSAISHLSNLIDQEGSTVDARIELARLLIEAGRLADAAPHIEQAHHHPGLTPTQQMRVAQLLHAAGREEEALPLAHTAYRAQPGDAAINRAFIMIALFGKGDVPAAPVVASDTYVRLRSADGNALEYTVLGGGTLDPRRGEISTADASASGLLGKAVGDKVVRARGALPQEWTVEEILPLVVREAQEAAIHYEDNFPGEPFFMTGLPVGDGTSVKDFAAIIASLERRKQHAELVFSMYREQGFPLGMISKLLGGSIADTMEHIIGERPPSGPLVVEWPVRAAYERSSSLAATANGLVVTASALHTMSSLGLLELLAGQYQLLAPRSLLDELRSELADAERMVSQGHKTLASTGDGLRFEEIAAHSPSLVRRRDTIQSLLEFVSRSIELEPRPLQSIGRSGSQSDELRDIVGRESFDALALAVHRKLVLYADDLGLRRLEYDGTQPSSVATPTILNALAVRGCLSADDRDRHLSTLAIRHYGFIMPTRELLLSALRRANELSQEEVASVFATLGFPGIEPGDAARLTAQTVRSYTLVPVRLIQASQIALLALRAMAATWPPRICVRLLLHAIATDLALLPEASVQVRQACKEFLGDRDNPERPSTDSRGS